jgi:hypothetical protein
MYGDEKPKRKREESSNSLDFVTALTVEQCVERLERGPAHTLDYRLTVRTDGQRFVVEALGAYGAPQAGTQMGLANFQGHLSRISTGNTRVHGITIKKNPYVSIPAWVIFPATPIIIFTAMVVTGRSFSLENILLFLLITGVTTIPLGLLYLTTKYYARKIDKRAPDLRRWVRKQLDIPPEQQTP